MPDRKENVAGKRKIKKKISKAQMLLAIVKKKQCDVKALAIVERLLEPNVESEWLLQNLGQINKSHMEDVIEERAITKLCGYVLCQNPITVTMTQQYHICTRKNKVYDVTQRKKFCSSRCYGAGSYLLEQMLTSPLWLRDDEEIPTFRLLEAANEAERSLPGEEIIVKDFNVATDAEKSRSSNTEAEEEAPTKDPEESIRESDNTQNEIVKEDNTQNAILKEDNTQNEIPEEDNTQDKNTCTTVESSMTRDSTAVTLDKNIATVEKLEDVGMEGQDVLQQLSSSGFSTEESNSLIQLTKNFQSHSISIDELNESMMTNDEHSTNSNTHKNADDKVSKQTDEPCDKRVKMKRDAMPSKQKKNQHNYSKEHPTRFYTIAVHIEQCVQEWITSDTLALLSGEENARNQLLEQVSQVDKYLQVCKKLNQIQLKDEKEDRSDIASNELKPLPHLSVLQEEGKKMELKVRAFYQGNVLVEQPNPSMDVVEDDNASAPILPLIDAHAPKALRRRIFLDKLHKILPDLLLALSSGNPSMQYNYSERNVLIKALVNTFALSANNIIFKSTEWTLVGLIIIKMLSILDPLLERLLATKQASMYISMILMSYKLDSNFLVHAIFGRSPIV